MAPVLHAHTDTSLALGYQQNPIFILGQISRYAFRAFSFPALLFPLYPQPSSTMGTSSSSVYSQPTDGLSGRDQEAAFGHGRVGVEGQLEDRASRRRKTDLAAARLTERGSKPYAHHGTRARRFRVWVLLAGSSIDRSPGVHDPRRRGCKNYDDTVERFGRYPRV
jgi:hypothetical protein